MQKRPLRVDRKKARSNLFVLAVVSLAGVAVSVGLNAKGRKTTVPHGLYPYCNVYLTNLCFGTGPGDVLVKKVPFDYVTYDIKLSTGAYVSIFEGNNVSDPFRGKKPNLCDHKLGNRCEFIYSLKEYVLMYQASANSTIVVIHISGIDDSNRKSVESFVSNFRPCSPIDQSEECANISLFAGVGSEERAQMNRRDK